MWCGESKKLNMKFNLRILLKKVMIVCNREGLMQNLYGVYHRLCQIVLIELK